MSNLSLTIDAIVNLLKKQGVTDATISHGALPVGSRVELWRDSVRLRSIVVADGATDTTVNLTGADWGADGSRKFKVRIVEAGGQVAGAWSEEQTVLVDTRAPSRPSVISVSGDGKINAAEHNAPVPVVISHESAVDGAKLDILVGGVVVKTVTLTAGDSSTTVDIAANAFPASGTVAVSARMIDPVGNVGSASTERSVVVMAGAPAAVSFGTLGDDGNLSQSEKAGVSTIVVAHAATTAGGRIEIWRDGVFVKSVSVATGAESTSVRLSGADWGGDGSHLFKARLVDGAGNEGSWSAEQAVNVDTVAPDAVTLSVVAVDGLVNTAERASAGFTVSHQAGVAGDVIEIYRDRVLVKTVTVVPGATESAVVLAGAEWGAEGAHALRARLVDAAGNAGLWSGNAQYSVDTTAPVALVLPVIARDDIVSSAEKTTPTTITVRHELAVPGSLVELSRDGTVLKSVAVTSRTTATSFVLADADWGADGTHSFKVRLTDAAGNVGAWSDARDVLVLSQAPTAPTIGVIATDGIVNLAEKAASTTLSITHQAAVAGSVLELYRDQALIRRVTLASGATSTDVVLTGSDWGADGSHDLKARIIDTVGNTGAFSQAATVVVDTRPPSAVTLPPITGDDLVSTQEKAADVTVTLAHAAAESGSKLQLFRDGQLWKTVSLTPGATSTNVVIAPGDWGSVESLLLKARLVDASGNAGVWTAERTVVIGGVVPAALVLPDLAADGMVNAAEKRATTTISIDHAAMVQGSRIEIFRDDALLKSVLVSAGATSTVVSLSGAEWGVDGLRHFKARMVNAAGGTGNFSAAQAVTVDTIAPLAINAPAIGVDDRINRAEKTAGVSFSISHEAATAGATVEIYRDGDLLKSVTPTVGATSTSISLAGTDFGAEGTRVFKLRFIDAAGNAGTWGAERRVLVDTIADAAPQIDVMAGDDIVNATEKATSRTVNVTHVAAEMGARLAIYRDGEMIKTVTVGFGATSTSVTFVSADWGDDGQHAFTARLIDQAGNESDASTPRLVKVATGAPNAPLLATLGGDGQIGADEKAANTTVVVTHAALAAAGKLEVYRDGTKIKTVDVGANATSSSLVLTGSEWGADGTRTFKVRIVDGSGNVSAYSADQKVIVDTVAPVAPTVAAIDDNIINASEKAATTSIRVTHELATAGAMLELWRDATLVKSVAAATGAKLTVISVSGDDWGSDGQHVLKTRLVDGAGNKGAFSTDLTITVATATPAAVTWGAVTADDVINAEEKAGTVTVNLGHAAVTAAGAKIEIYRDGRLLKTAAVTVGDVSTAVAFSSDDWSSDGSHIYTARLIDADGNIGTWSTGKSVLVDSIKPVSASISTLPGFGFVGVAELSASSNMVIQHESGTAGGKVQLYRGDVLLKSVNVVAGDLQTIVEMDGADWGDDGVYQYKARYVDAAGNAGTFSAQRQVTVSLPFALAAISGGNINAAEKNLATQLTVSHAALGTGWTLELYRGETRLATKSVTADATSTVFTVTGADWGSDGTHVIKVKAISPEAGVFRFTPERSVLVDTIAPDGAGLLLGVMAGDDKVTSMERHGSADTVVTHAQAGAGWKVNVYRDGEKVTSFAVLEGSTSTHINLTGEQWGAEGNRKFSVTLEDAAGNTSAASPERTVAVGPNSALDMEATAIRDSSALLMWDPYVSQASNAVIGYKIYKNGQFVAETASSSYKVGDLDASSSYQFSLKVTENGTEVAGGDEVHVTTTATDRWDIAQVYSAYIDVGVGPVTYNQHLKTIETSGLKAVTLGFLVLRPEGWRDDMGYSAADYPPALDENGLPTGNTEGLRWGELNKSVFPNDMVTDQVSVRAMIAELKAKGIAVTIALGGYSGSEPALFETDVKKLTAIYQSIIDEYGVSHLDIDIEGPSLNTIGQYHGWYPQSYLDLTHKNRIEALKAIQLANPDVTISYTIPILPSGMLPNAVALMQMVKDEGFDLDVLNIMAMDYGTNEPDQGRNAIDAAQNTIRQLRQMGLTTKVGITPMIGINDVVKEIFTLDDARDVLEYAKDNPDIASIGIWSLGRDQASDPGPTIGQEDVLTNGSGIKDQTRYEFSNIFNAVTDSGMGYDPASGLTVFGTVLSGNLVGSLDRNKSTQVTVSFSPAAAGSRLQILRDGVVIKTVSLTTGTISRAITLSGADWGAEGVREFTARVVDSSEHVLSTSAVQRVKIDLTAPEIATIGVQAGDDKLAFQEASNGLAFTFVHNTAEAGTKARIFRDNVLIKTVTLVADSIETKVMLYGDSWGQAGTSSAPVYTVQLPDTAGNTSALSQGRKINVSKYATVKNWDPTGYYSYNSEIPDSQPTFVLYNGVVYKTRWSPAVGSAPGSIADPDYNPWAKVETISSANPESDMDGSGFRLIATALKDDSVMLMWDKQVAEKTGATVTYKIYNGATLLATTSGLSKTLTGLSPNTDYNFIIKVAENGTETANETNLAVATPTVDPWDIAQYYSPYIDMGLGASVAHLSGLTTSTVKNITLAFLVLRPQGWRDDKGDSAADFTPTLDANGLPTGITEGLRWGERNTNTFPTDTVGYGAAERNVTAVIKELRQKGINVTIGLGGFSGSEPALYETNVVKLTALYQSIIDQYGVNRLDIDIEGASLNSKESGGYHGFYPQAYLTQTHLNRIEALKAIKEANPDVEISYTIPITPQGMLQNAKDLMQLVYDHGLELDVLNIMAMDYGAGDWGHRGDQGRNAIDAARNTIRQLREIGLEHVKVGITPMIGVNDVTTEIFTLEDAQEVLAYAKDNPDIASIGIWSLNRDRQDVVQDKSKDQTGLTVNGSGLVQDPLAFTSILQGVTDDGAGYNPRTGLTVIDDVSTDNRINKLERQQIIEVGIDHGVAVAGSSLQILRDNVVIKTVEVTTGSTHTLVNMSGNDWGVADSMYALSARIVVGGVAGVASEYRKVWVDTEAPVKGAFDTVSTDNKITGGEAGAGLKLTLHYGAASAGTELQVFRNGVLYRSMTVAVDSTVTDIVINADGMNTVGTKQTVDYTAKLIDLAGNVSDASTALSVSFDQWASVKAWTAGEYYGGVYAHLNGIVYRTKWYSNASPLVDSAWENLGPLVTSPDAPLDPQRLFATGLRQDKAFLMWDAATAVGGAAVTGYDISVDGVIVGSVSANDTQYALNGLTGGHTYAVKVLAKSAYGSSAGQQSLSVTTLSAPVADINQTYNPIVDVSVWGTNLLTYKNNGALQDMTLSYIHSAVTNESTGATNWFWYGAPVTGTKTGRVASSAQDYFVNETKANVQMADVQADVGLTLSFNGGFSTDVAMGYTDATAMKTKLLEVSDWYGVKKLDFSIGAAQMASYTANVSKFNILADAVKAADLDRGGILEISYTVQASSHGLTDATLSMLKAAHAKGVDIDVLNVQAMDYYGEGTNIDMGRAAIDVALDAISKLHEAGYMDTKVGIIVRNGVNGGGTTFMQSDAYQLLAFAQDNPDIAGVGLWTIARDNNGDNGIAGSGISQTAYEFSRIFGVL